MKAARIHQFGPPEVIDVDEITRPEPGEGEILVRTAFSGVAQWDALIRERKSVVDLELPIILGSDLAGTVESLGPGVTEFKPGDQIYGVTNKQFCGAYAEYAIASAGMVAAKPESLNFAEAASVPVVAVTAWQMLFDYAKVQVGQSVLIHGAGGNVGAYGVQLARLHGLHIYATAGPKDLEYVKEMGADVVVDYTTARFERVVPRVDAVIDMVGGETQRRSFDVLNPNGILVSVVSPFHNAPPGSPSIRSVFFLVDVTTARLNLLTELFERKELKALVGTVLPLSDVRLAHQMLAGSRHARGKIVLKVSENG